ncbi:dUTP diphosphatase [Fictibacillus sp. WQ 8-8]|uniref:dUTP diphosphatase n=1 Tax=Fictibacillus sp. WQ 8-8 TaxID=2938788 RepID=UPI0008F2D0FE|nr:dUTP diphosphatase [Fictibacillus sp. WQ 8-8]MCQ6266520.1 dUTP diphosphatase [Fictibacillus sp. WQ 8-8]SFD60057.1 Dimeric dUTPase, all-alpha-NTP-PPase (MazG) superfamily [Bacillus sp. OV194]
MGFKELFEMQKHLNDRIIQEHGLHNDDLYDQRLLALLVELGELANETRCFKYWSVKPASSDSVILEEYVDGLHFILSVGLDMGMDDIEIHTVASNEDLTGQFLSLYRLISGLQGKKDKTLFSQLFSEFIGLGQLLGFSVENIVDGYYKKNEINHQRQDEGY